MADEEQRSSDIKSDSEWKDRVKAEAAALDAEQAQSSEEASNTSTRGSEIDEGRLPAASFDTMVQMFSTQAMVSLGAIPEPGTDEPVLRLGLARHFIDLLNVLEEKTKGNLTNEEEQLLTSSVHYLRMVYLEQSKQAASGAGGTGPSESPS